MDLKYRYFTVSILCLVLICVLGTQTTYAYLVSNITNTDNTISAASLGYEITAYASDDSSLGTSDVSVTLLAKSDDAKSDDANVITQANLILVFENTEETDIKIYYEVWEENSSEAYISEPIEVEKDTTSTSQVISLSSSGEYEIKVYYEYASSDLDVTQTTCTNGDAKEYDSYYFEYEIPVVTNQLVMPEVESEEESKTETEEEVESEEEAEGNSEVETEEAESEELPN